MMQALPLDAAKIVVNYVNTGHLKCKDTASFALTCKFFNTVAADQLSENEKQYNPIDYLKKILRKINNDEPGPSAESLLALFDLLSDYTGEALRRHQSALILYLSLEKPYEHLSAEIVDFIEAKLLDAAIKDMSWVCEHSWEIREAFNQPDAAISDPWTKIFKALFEAYSNPDPDPFAEVTCK